MHKKNIALIATLMSINASCLGFGQESEKGFPASQGYQPNQGYSAEQGYQTGRHHGHHHHHSGYSPADEAALLSYENEIKDILEEGKDPYFKSNICWVATAGGALACAAGLSSDKSNNLTVFGGAVALLGGAIGIYTRHGESLKVQEREDRIKDRRNRQDKIREGYRSRPHN